MSTPEDVILEQELRQQLGTEKTDLADRIIFGQRVEEWLERDPVGAYLIGRAQEKIDSATQLFLNSNDLNCEEVKRAHFEAHVAATLVDWLRGAVEDGNEAEKAIKSTEQMTDELEGYTDE